MSDNETMSGAELRTIRQGLGVTVEWLATLLRIAPRTVTRWETGDQPIPPGISDEMQFLLGEATTEVVEHVASFTRPGQSPEAIVILNYAAAMPIGWQRAIAFRVLLEVPRLRIIDRSEDQQWPQGRRRPFNFDQSTCPECDKRVSVKTAETTGRDHVFTLSCGHQRFVAF